MKTIHVVGARPNFMKVAPVMAALATRRGVVQRLVHTGQHYDKNMSDVFFVELGMPRPDFNLEVGSGSHAQQTAQVMSKFEPVLLDEQPDMVCVYGDVNSTMAATLVATKLGVAVAHVEAGLRSFDRTMPEELNRLVTDQLADLLFTPSSDGDQNLAREGVDAARVHLVGNVMIDTLHRLLPDAAAAGKAGPHAEWLGREFALVTLHRPSNVDEPARLEKLLLALSDIAASIPVLFPIHPRTRARIAASGLLVSDDVKLVDPLSYLTFLALQQRARVVITDSGGVQEETTYLGVPCLTLRANTERPVTVTVGTNKLLGDDVGALREEVAAILAGRGKRGTAPPLWDGRASERIADVLENWYAAKNNKKNGVFA